MFPQVIGMGATWDPALIHQVADVISTEARAKYNYALEHNNRSIFFGLTLWAPNINIFRDPRWGRGQETYGEDPYLTSRMGVAFVEGIQGNNPKYFRAIATPKHFAVYSGPEPLRHESNVNPTPQDFEATYLPAFRAVVVKGKADSIMCSYNAVYGVPSCANSILLKKKLRDEWKFKGFVTSDCFAITNIWKTHHYAPDLEHAAAVSLKAGTDTSCGQEYAILAKAVRDKLVSEQDLDTAVRRLFTARFKMGMFDPPSDVPYSRIPMTEVDTKASRSLALKVAEESIVLLKNAKGILPLSSGTRSIAVIGPNAVELPALEGNYNGQPSHPVLPLDGIEKRFSATAKITFAEGSTHVDGLDAIVPRTVFRDGAKQIGLKAEYFNNAAFEGKPTLTRIDHEISFDWNASPPVSGVNPNAFSVRWTGTISVPGAGNYSFKTIQPRCFYSCDTNEHYRIFIDDKLVAEGGVNRSKALGGEIVGGGGDFTMHFADTSPHSFRFEYSHVSQRFGAGLEFVWQPPTSVVLDEAVKVASKADIVIACMGLTPRLEGEEFPIDLDGFKGGDRTKLDIPQVQLNLLKAVAATGKPIILVLMNGSALAIPWSKAHASAIVEAWYPGESGGTAIANVLSGNYDPAGRLPITMYASLDQLPSFKDYSMRNRTYRYFKDKPLYGFGYGLSYTQFAYKNLKVGSERVEAGQPLTVSFDVTNTGRRNGQEVAQLYIEGPDIEGGALRRLAEFQRFSLRKGATKHLAFQLDSRQLSEVDHNGMRAVRAGAYKFFVGGGQPRMSQGLQGSFEIRGTVKLKP